MLSCTTESSDELSAKNETPCTPTVTVEDIFAGQNILVGYLEVTNDDQNLFVSYNTENGWYMEELHVFVGDFDEVPDANGNPKPGRFVYKATLSPLLDTYTFTIPLNEVVVDAASGCYVVAAHSVVKLSNGNGGYTQSETGWAGSLQFPGNNWATYLHHCPADCDDNGGDDGDDAIR